MSLTLPNDFKKTGMKKLISDVCIRILILTSILLRHWKISAKGDINKECPRVEVHIMMAAWTTQGNNRSDSESQAMNIILAPVICWNLCIYKVIVIYINVGYNYEFFLVVVAQSPSCVWLFIDPMDCNMPGLPVPHHLLESAQLHIHGTDDAIQPFHSLTTSSLSAFSLSQSFLWEIQRDAWAPLWRDWLGLSHILQKTFGWGQKNQEPFTLILFTTIICLFCKVLTFTWSHTYYIEVWNYPYLC